MTMQQMLNKRYSGMASHWVMSGVLFVLLSLAWVVPTSANDDIPTLDALPGTASQAVPVALEEAILRAGDAQANDYFGYSVALSGNTALVGAYGEDTDGEDAGAAYVFVQDSNGVWSEQATLRAGDAQAGDYFGYSVALSNDTALIGALLEDTDGQNAGAAYVFARDTNGAWSEQATLRASDAQADGLFGRSVALSGDTALIGAATEAGDFCGFRTEPGTAYIFERDDKGVWSEQAILRASDAQESDDFGYSVALSGNIALIGAPCEDTGGSEAGAAYVFERDSNGVWSEEKILRASDAQTGDLFGTSVAVNGDTSLIGANLEDTSDANAGAAYVFERGSNSIWSEQAILRASDAQAQDYFGHAVVLNNDTAVISANQEDTGGQNSGAAYVFKRDSSGFWNEQAILRASDAQAEDIFGYSLALSEETALVGAFFEDTGGSDAGAAYVFATSTFTPEIDLQGNETSITNGDTTPDSVDGTAFGAANIDNTTVTQTFTIANSGTVALELSGTPLVEVTGTDAAAFSVTTAPDASIAAGDNTTFAITFTPQTIGVHTATVSIASNDADESPYTFAIQATGYAQYDLTRDGIISPTDAIYVINLLSTDDDLADVNNDATVDAADVDAVRDNLGQ